MKRQTAKGVMGPGQTPAQIACRSAARYDQQASRADTEMAKRLRLIGTIIVILAASLWYKECVVVDICLDRGGAWDRERNECIPR